MWASYKSSGRICLLFLAVFLLAAPDAGALEEGVYYPVREVLDGDTLVLETGDHVRLLSIQAPEVAHEEKAAEPFSAESTQALEALVGGGKVRLDFDKSKKDRYDRWLAQLYTENGAWVQESLLKGGMARVYSFPDNRMHLKELLAAEAGARAARKGLWAHPAYQVYAAERVDIPGQAYALIEGVVRKAALVRGHVYLNFGEDWKTDTTFFIHEKNVPLFTKKHVNLLALEGKRVRGRGWVFPKNGPMIELTHPEQLELLFL